MNNTRGFKKKLIASAIASYAAFGITTQALAQENTVDEIVVTGVRAALISAMETKRNAPGVLEAINAEDIGKFPDTNMAESLQRVPGVSIDREGGEGKFVTVRGFGAGFNITTLNGRQLTSEDTNRDFEFDTLGADMISGLVINKSGSALGESGGIGATIDIKTARPLEVGDKISGGLKMGYETLNEESAPEGSILVSHKFADDTFGALLAYNHFERESTVDRVTNNHWTRVPVSAYDPSDYKSNASTTGYVYQPQNHFINVQRDRRTRDNANLVLQFAPTDKLTLTGDVLYSKYELLRDQNMLVNWFGSRAGWHDIETDKNGTITHFVADDKDVAGGFVQNTEFNAIRENRKSDTLEYGLNAKYEITDNFSVIADVYKSESNYKDPNGFGNSQVTMGYRNRLTWDMTGNSIPAISGFETGTGTDGRQPDANGNLTIPNKDYLDPSNLRPGFTIRNGRVVKDTMDQFKLEGVFKSDEATGLVKSTFGVSHKSHEKDRESYTTGRGLTPEEWSTVKANQPNVPDWVQGALNCMFCDGGFYWTKITPPKVTVLDAGSGFLSGVSKTGPIQTKWLQFDYDEFRKIYEGAVGLTFNTAKVPSDTFGVTEGIDALYTQLEFAGDVSGHNYYFVTGLRYERTDLDIDGRLASLKSVFEQGEVLGKVLSDATPVTLKSSYDEFLPNIDFKFNFTDDLIGRVDFSKTITRPAIDALRPNLSFGDLKTGGPYPVNAGNPELKPLESQNIDLALEWYYANGSYASAGLFYKQVDNFIVDATSGQKINDATGKPAVDPTTDQEIVFQVTKPSNVETAKVNGFEFAVQHMFGESGFGAVVNGTIVNTNAEYDVNKFDSAFALLGLSDSYNLVGFYENDQFQVRLAYNWRDEFLRAVTDSEPHYVKAYGQFDLSASYNLTSNITLTFDGINITDEATQWRGRYSNHFELAETSGPRYSVGVRASF
jgi:TonB-dependent receptor